MLHVTDRWVACDMRKKGGNEGEVGGLNVVTKTSHEHSPWLVFASSSFIPTTNTPKPKPYLAKPTRTKRLQLGEPYIDEAILAMWYQTPNKPHNEDEGLMSTIRTKR